MLPGERLHITYPVLFKLYRTENGDEKEATDPSATNGESAEKSAEEKEGDKPAETAAADGTAAGEDKKKGSPEKKRHYRNRKGSNSSGDEGARQR